MNELVIGSLDYLMSLRLDGGNYPSRVGKSEDRLVQVCEFHDSRGRSRSMHHDIYIYIYIRYRMAKRVILCLFPFPLTDSTHSGAMEHLDSHSCSL